VVLLELVIDPTCSLVFEAEPSSAGAMRRPPRRRGETLFGPRQIWAALIQGLVLLGAVLGLYAWSLSHFPEAQARGAAFLALALGNLVLALSDSAASLNLFGRHRRIYWAIVAFVALALAAVFCIPGPAAMFEVERPAPGLLALALAAALVGGGWSALFGLVRAARPSAT
jgi:Ca2+-transporting ATPase